jgi:cell division septal protein FtsQ
LSWSQLLKIGVAIVVVVGLVEAYRAVTVDRVLVSNNNGAADSQLTTLVHEELSSHLLWQNLVTIDTGGMSNQMLDNDYGLATVVITRQWPHTLIVNATNRQPSYIWKTGESQYLLDSSGGIIGPAPAGEKSLIVIEDESGLAVKVGERVVSDSYISFCTTLLSAFPKTGLKAGELQVPATTQEVDVKTTSNYIVKFDTTRSAGAQLGDLIVALKQLSNMHKTPGQYIDVRISGRAYWQ